MCLLNELLSQFGEPVSVLDVGGTPEFWRNNAPTLSRRIRLTLLNLHRVDPPTNGISIVGDGRQMPKFRDGQYDACVSNSAIEHVGTLDDQRQFAAEIRRVSRAYLVQTPNKYFPVEPHFIFPGWQFLPRGLRVALHRHLTLGWSPRQPDPALAAADVDQIRLLTRSELRSLFHDARLVPERFAGLVKSWIALRRP